MRIISDSTLEDLVRYLDADLKTLDGRTMGNRFLIARTQDRRAAQVTLLSIWRADLQAEQQERRRRDAIAAAQRHLSRRFAC